MTVDEPRSRPILLDGIGVILLQVVAAAMWGYFLVSAIARGAYGLAALDAGALVLSVWTIRRVVRRRRGQRT